MNKIVWKSHLLGRILGIRWLPEKSLLISMLSSVSSRFSALLLGHEDVVISVGRSTSSCVDISYCWCLLLIWPYWNEFFSSSKCFALNICWIVDVENIKCWIVHVEEILKNIWLNFLWEYLDSPDSSVLRNANVLFLCASAPFSLSTPRKGVILIGGGYGVRQNE